VLDDHGLSNEWKTEFTGIRNVLDKYLDEYPEIPTSTVAGAPPKRRIITPGVAWGRATPNN